MTNLAGNECRFVAMAAQFCGIIRMRRAMIGKRRSDGRIGFLRSFETSKSSFATAARPRDRTLADHEEVASSRSVNPP
jgi:hypothetical protein